MWFLPLLIVLITVVLAIPLGLYMARVLDRSEAGNVLERTLMSGQQNWKQYCFALLSFNAVAFVIGFVVLATQPYHPAFLNPDGKGMLAPGTIFNTASSFLTNTNLQHYSGEIHLTYFSQLFFVCWKQFVTPAIGLAALLAVIRGLRGNTELGNFYLDVWRSVVYLLLPLSLIVAVLLLAGGVPMTLEGDVKALTLEGQEQIIARGPVAAIVAIKQLGTNGGGFFGANSCHPFENPTAWTNIIECVSIILIPFAILIMFGRMLGVMRHAIVIASVMMLFLVSFITWSVVTDTQHPNAGLSGLPLEHDSGNLEGKEVRLGRSAGTVWASITTCTSNGSVNCMHDSLNPLAGLAPLAGMWLNCIFGGVGVGLINMFIYILIAVFLAGLMVGRSPEYLGKKIEAREIKLAMIALLVHPLMILVPAGIFAVMSWGPEATNNPGAHGFSEIVYEFSSASANNGSEFGGLSTTFGFNDTKANPSEPAQHSLPWDVATGVVMVLSRFVPIIAPIAIAGSLARKRRAPHTVGTLRTDTLMFGAMLMGTIVLVGALLFLPVALLGPVAAHLGPVPFGG